MKQKTNIALKFFGLFSVVRGYNLWAIFLALYFSALFVLSPFSFEKTLGDPFLFLLITANLFAIAGGYIINDFYDSEKDWINKPLKTMINQWVGQKTKLGLYFLLNAISVGMAWCVTYQQGVFFLGYLFGLWFYSHKLKKKIILGNICSALLSMLPFFSILLYYQNFEAILFIHALFLFLLILLREITKDVLNIQGDMLYQYQTIAVQYGEKWAKRILFILVGITYVPLGWLFCFSSEKMSYYFLFSKGVLLVFGLGMYFFRSKKAYRFLYNLLKINLLLGVFSLMFYK